MTNNKQYLNKVREWLEISRAALDAPLPATGSDVTEIMKRTETLLAASRAICLISSLNRKHAEAIRTGAQRGRLNTAKQFPSV